MKIHRIREDKWPFKFPNVNNNIVYWYSNKEIKVSRLLGLIWISVSHIDLTPNLTPIGGSAIVFGAKKKLSSKIISTQIMNREFYKNNERKYGSAKIIRWREVIPYLFKVIFYITLTINNMFIYYIMWYTQTYYKCFKLHGVHDETVPVRQM